MKIAQTLVRNFMEAVGQDVPQLPCIPPKAVQDLRIKLHEEEAVKELREAFEAGDVYLVADSIADSLVVVLGTAVACGIDIRPIFNEVMHSNMSKVPDGYKREDGKWMKGPSYRPPNIQPILDRQEPIDGEDDSE